MEGREKPIDFLVRDLMLGEEFEVGAEEPYKVFESLTLAEVHEAERGHSWSIRWGLGLFLSLLF